MPYHAARAVAYGLDHEEAIRALTINPAKVFGSLVRPENGQQKY